MFRYERCGTIRTLDSPPPLLDCRQTIDVRVGVGASDRQQPLRALAHLALRCVISTHFVYELIDKCVRFDHWRSVILTQTGLGSWSLILVILLLLVGTVFLLLNKFLTIATLSLAIFQVPTSVLFEQSGYERADSASALGGVFALLFISSVLTREDESDVNARSTPLLFEEET